MTYICRDERFI